MDSQEIIEVFNNDPNLCDSLMGGYAPSNSQLKGVDKTLVEDVGGEDMGSEYYAVWEFKASDRTFYLRFNGSYYSYDGATYEEFYEVTPEEVTIIQYKKV